MTVTTNTAKGFAASVKAASVDNLDVGIVGNCGIGALVDASGRIVWCCFPRFDGDPVFHRLLGELHERPGGGEFAIELEGFKTGRQEYVANTAILKTTLEGESGIVEITDFVPRFTWRDRRFRPQMLIRRVVPIAGSPRIRIKVSPRFNYGADVPVTTSGSNHIRYIGEALALRLTTDVPIDYVSGETYFNLAEPVNLVFGPDETLSEGPVETARVYEQRTRSYWQSWSHRLALPLEWQDAVIRAAITLKLCSYEPTGAIVAALTTSIPEAANSERNWDYRFCWVRDAFFVVRALNSLAAVRTMENYFRWIMNVVADANGGHIQPVFGIGLEKKLSERTVTGLPGYRGMGPVRVGNQAHEHFQHDTYGNLVLGAAQAFYDKRLFVTPGQSDFAPTRSCRRTGVCAARSAGCRDVGIALAGAGPYVVQPDVLGGVRPAGKNRQSYRDCGNARSYGNAGRPRSVTSYSRARGNEKAPRPSSRASKVSIWMQACC